MARSTPTVSDATLFVREEAQGISIAVGSERWFEWLEQQTSTIFSFQALHGSYTARKERIGNHRGGWYWKAYRKSEGKLYRAYLGKSEDLTLARLSEIALILATRIHTETAKTQHLSPQYSSHLPAGVSVMPLLETKLHPPRLPALLIERSRLLTLLAGEQKLTLVQAPAGFGKTTLATQWVTQRQAAGGVIAWLSLDAGDNDPIRFWSSLITACQIFHAQVGQMALAQLSRISRSPFSSSPLETVLTFLLNDLAGLDSPGVLILEDYHCIEHPRVHETLTFFIEHLPSALQVVLLTRRIPSLPLTRWRAGGDLREVTSGQLRFDAAETDAFLQQVLHSREGFVPPIHMPEALLRLSTHLEGWAAGLRLLALSVQNHMAEQTIEDALTQFRLDAATDHAQRSIQEYFLSEILAVQPEPLQRFLLQTSILSRLTGSLCDVVTGGHESAEWLATAERSGFFLEALESEAFHHTEGAQVDRPQTSRVWYRYHSLWASTIRAEAARHLGEKTMHSLALKASHWYEAHAMLVEAIDTALSAQEFERAALLIARFNEDASFREHHTLLGWLKQLPDPLLRSHPTLCFCAAYTELMSEGATSQLAQHRIEGLFQTAEEGWRKRGDLEKIGMLLAFRAAVALLGGYLAQAAVYARQSLHIPSLGAEGAPVGDQSQSHRLEWADWRCSSLMILGMEAMHNGFFEPAHSLLVQAYALSLKGSDRVLSAVLSGLLSEVCIELGELHQAAFYCQQTPMQPVHLVDVQDEKRGVLRHANATWGQIRLAYEWNQTDQAEQLVREASFERSGGPFASWEERTHVKFELGRLLALRLGGDDSGVRAALSALLADLATTPRAFPFISEVRIWQTRWHIWDGDLAGAERTLALLAQSEQALSLLQQETFHLLHVRLHLARGEAEAALPLLEHSLSDAQARRHFARIVEIQLLIALAYAARKQGQEARRQITLTLAQTRNEGFRRLFLDEGEPLAVLLRQVLPTLTEKPLRTYVQSLLSAFTHALSSHAKHVHTIEGLPLEPLSTQEQRVLTLLVAGRSNPEIADILVISVNTVKGHVKNLYRKLGVNNRMQASAVARCARLV
ncbi:hypothetical protein KSC_093020 [Ktedonobacter sp. SOSP1-52]|uniref:LuxR C-terminal-related transcriptional regulator n=1 Tax=Ktedonobacter sp. SOSP1-52 TaxID=2778366 RepID=UPI001915D3FA|nr:LuxR C-terminal-related transcriptional regulator [Ktedonobacter sp. SOSP1-52]GHO70410.1 hypothetical protein KSC_093020 [Ktedonobacter sp. SOSP1-52]